MAKSVVVAACVVCLRNPMCFVAGFRGAFAGSPSSDSSNITALFVPQPVTGVNQSGLGPKRNGPGPQRNGPGPQRNGPGLQRKGLGPQRNGPGPMRKPRKQRIEFQPYQVR